MNGSYEFTYKVDKAGEYDAVISSAGQTRTVRIKCKPAVLDPTQCAVAPLDENTRWRAGDVLVAKVLCRDRFGNDVAPPKSGDAAVDFVLLADGEGPSVVEAEIVDDPSGVGALAKFRATESGKYTLRVFTADVTRQWWGGVQRECIQGAPIELVLEASTGLAAFAALLQQLQTAAQRVLALGRRRFRARREHVHGRDRGDGGVGEPAVAGAARAPGRGARAGGGGRRGPVARGGPEPGRERGGAGDARAAGSLEGPLGGAARRERPSRRRGGSVEKV